LTDKRNKSIIYIQKRKTQLKSLIGGYNMKITNITWRRGNLNETVIEKLKEMGINWKYSQFCELLVDPYGVELWLPVRYKRNPLDPQQIGVEV
jgi:hypothetical protein